MGMNDGERQVAPNLDGIRADHVARYRLAAELLRGKHIIDVGCGVGYGSKLLADEGCKVRALDVSDEAIAYAQQHYSHKHVSYTQVNADIAGPFMDEDAAVCFEVIEHIEDPAPMLRRLTQSCGVLLASVPNELVFPYKGYRHHYRHYTPEQFEDLLNRSGWEVQRWYGQEGPESDCEPNVQGRTLIAYCLRTAQPRNGKWRELPEAPRPVPDSVAIVAMGRSSATYLSLCSTYGDRHLVADETWAINAMGGVLDHDLLFAMDDCKVQEARAALYPKSNIAGLLRWMKKHPRFFTSKVYDGYPGAHAYPLQEVINAIGVTYFNNTVAYAVAFAIYIGVKKISLFGADYTYKDFHKAESGRGCVEFLLGLAAARGIAVEVAHDSTLLDANVPKEWRPYGYDAYDVEFEQTDQGISVNLKERDTLPTPEEIEQRYFRMRDPVEAAA